MRRWRLELVLVAALLAGLVSAFLVGRARSPGLDLAAPAPCYAALQSVATTPPDDDVGSIAGAVEDTRELAFEELPEPSFLTPEALRARVEHIVSYPEARTDARVLAALGAVPEGFDLEAELSTLLGEQVVGFYDPDTGDLVVSAEGTEDGLDALEVLILVHELQHALADQALGLPDVGEPGPGEEDAAAALVALVEGDAQLTTEAFAARALSAEDRLELLLTLPGAAAGLEDTPHFLGRSLAFPYVEGAAFACELYGEGGWAEVDAAYAQPPSTTAQILFPERYRDGEEAARPEVTADLSRPWRPTPARALGAADLLFLFEAPGGDPGRALDDPLGRARAWGGGELRAWVRGGDVGITMALVQHPEEQGLCESVAAWYRAAFPDAGRLESAGNEALVADGDGQDAVIRCSGDQVRAGIGPDLDTARELSRLDEGGAAAGP